MEIYDVFSKLQDLLKNQGKHRQSMVLTKQTVVLCCPFQKSKMLGFN